MPLEINEIGIAMRVSSGGEPPADRDEGPDTCGDVTLSEEQREALIDECVRRVLEALRTRRER